MVDQKYKWTKPQKLYQLWRPISREQNRFRSSLSVFPKVDQILI